MKMLFRALSILVSVGFLMTTINWIYDPAAAAKNLGMELLTGVGASTQIGDISAFFCAIAVMTGLAQRTGQAHWFYPPAILVATAALMRTLAWLTGNAPFATEFIVPEVIVSAILVMAAKTRSETGLDVEV